MPVLRGTGCYVVAVLRELLTFDASALNIVVDGTEHPLEAVLVAVANGSTYGGGMRVAPQARLDSGRLEVCVVRRISRAGFLRSFPLVFRGRHVDHPRVTMLSGTRIEIRADRPHEVTGDGELIGRLPATFRVLPRELPVVVGRDAPLA